MNKKGLSIILEKLEKNNAPSPKLEQYSIGGEIASDILFKAYIDGNIENKIIADFGTGNGIFAIGACLLGAKACIGIDIDKKSILIANRNAHLTNTYPSFINANIKDICLQNIDTVFQNPPFGSQRKHADRIFIDKAISSSATVYSIHNANTIKFIENYVNNTNHYISWMQYYILSIPHMFKFHTKEKEHIKVIAVKIEKKSGDNNG
ncbi:MAG: METTL5 family protein [Thermoplasmata archaeon]